MPKYKNNYIYEMICEVRFSTILKINNDSSEELSKLQDKLKKCFPIYNQVNKNQYNLKINQDNENNLPQIFTKNNKSHIFLSEDNKMKVLLTSNYISLVTCDYSDFKTYKEKFQYVIKCFNQVFKINNFNRVGIRYVNTFSKEEFDIEDNSEWNRYFINEILGLTIKKKNIRVFNNNIEIPFDDKSQTRIISGFGERKQEDSGVTPVFILDMDTYIVNNIMYDDLISKVDSLHNHNSEIFESLITDKLRNKMGVIKDE